MSRNLDISRCGLASLLTQSSQIAVTDSRRIEAKNLTLASRLKPRNFWPRLRLLGKVLTLILTSIFVLSATPVRAQIGDGVCVAYCDEYVPPSTNDNSNGGYYTNRYIGQPHPLHPNVVWDGKYWTPAKGYEWVGTASYDYRVRRRVQPKASKPKGKASNPRVMKPSRSQQKKIQTQKQQKRWREKALAENKKCIKELDDNYFWNGDSV